MGKKKDLEIIYNLQWKNKPANGGNGDKANIIGMYDIPATTLNWTIFKSYLLKNSGFAGDDVRVSYITTNDREFPIESQTDFQIALYSFRRKARLGEIINLTLDPITDKESGPSTSNTSQKTMDVETQIESTEAISMTSSHFNTPPEWFLTLMAQYKKEIVDEVTASVSNIVSNIKPHTVTQSSCYHSRKSKVECPKRRKLPHLVGESSNDKDLLKSLKLEFKLENKLEKLERKTKKIKEKKLALFTKSSDSDAGHSSSRSRSNHVQEDDMEDELQMDAAPVNGQTNVPHMLGGEVYMHRWEVMNVGKAPWTSKTTLNFAWGSKTFQPLDTIVSCPYLKPMEKGVINVRFQVPRESGRYESYWRFHHKGRRFGQWLGCQITVDPFDLRGHSSVLDTTCPSTSAMNLNQVHVNVLYPEIVMPTEPLHENHYMLNVKPEKPDTVPVQQNVFNDIAKPEESDSDRDLSLCAFDTESDEPFTNEKIERESSPQASSSLLDDMVKEVAARVDDLTVTNPNNEDVTDNVSVASGSESNSSKNEEFVVIPTPNCFKLDEECKDEVKIENTEEGSGEKVSTSVENYDDNNNTEDTNQNSSSESISRVEDELPSEEASQKSDMVIVNLPSDQEIDAKGYAFLMVDGVAIPVPKKYLKEEYLNNAQGEPDAKPSTVQEKIEEETAAEQTNVEQENVDLSHCSATGSCFSEARELPQRWFIFPQTVPGYEVVNSCNRPETSGLDVTQSTPNLPQEHTGYVSPILSHYTQPPASAPVYYPQSYPMDLSSAHSPRPQQVPEYYNIPPNTQEEYNGGSECNRSQEHFQRMHASPGNVQILPETLMSGVVNVASSAINTARSVINIIKPREPGRWVNGHWIASTPDSPREANLRALAEMGFWDRDLNATLLQRFNDDLNRVVSELVQ